MTGYALNIHFIKKSALLSLLVTFFMSQCAPQPSLPTRTGQAVGDYVEVDGGEGASVVSALEAKPTALEAATVQKRSRPGLGTGWGDAIASPISSQRFVRSGTSPIAMATMYYNDKEGVESMTNGHQWRDDKLKRVANNMVEWGVKGKFGFYNSVQANGKRFVIGREGRQYSLVVKNVCDSRLEFVISVDGLDVIDGDPASLRKRGYIVEPGEVLTVKGFRTSEEAVAAFQFSTVGASYTNMRHGVTRNVGVIGLAVYGEKGVDPWRWSKSELDTRAGARAFAEAPLVRGR